MNEPNPGVAYNEAVKNILPHIEQIIFQSIWSKETICGTLEFEPKNYRIIYNATDIEFFKPAKNIPEIKTKDDYIYIICTGSLRRNFRINIPFGILKRLPLKAKLIFVGSIDNECKSELNKISESKYSDRVIYIPHMDNRKLLEYLQLSDIMLHPVQGDACPNSVIEALSCGIPVVCGSWGGQAELIGNGGKVVTNHKKWDYSEAFAEDCCKALEEIAANLDEYKINARKRAVEKFNLQRLYNEYYEVMQNDPTKSNME